MRCEDTGIHVKNYNSTEKNLAYIVFVQKQLLALVLTA